MIRESIIVQGVYFKKGLSIIKEVILDAEGLQHKELDKDGEPADPLKILRSSSELLIGLNDSRKKPLKMLAVSPNSFKC